MGILSLQTNVSDATLTQIMADDQGSFAEKLCVSKFNLSLSDRKQDKLRSLSYHCHHGFPSAAAQQP